MQIRTTGVVIREQVIGDTSRLVTVLTKEIGIIKAFVNGSRRPNSKNVAATGLLCYSDFSIDKTKKDVYRIQEATSIDVFFDLREDILSLALAQYFAEIIFELAPREENADEYLKLLLNSIHLIINKKRDYKLIKSAFELRLLSIAGYMPNLIACDNCGKFESEVMYFRINFADLYCQNCKPADNSLTLNIGVVTAMRHICFCDAKKMFNFSLSDKGLDSLNYTTEMYLKSITSRKFKTLEFYKSMTD